MKKDDIRALARKLGLQPGSETRFELIRLVQEAEGNPPCFDSGPTRCSQVDCLWMADCIPAQYARLHQAVGVGARTGEWRR